MLVCRGTEWGEGGYIRLKRSERSASSLPFLGHWLSLETSSPGVCGLALSAALPLGGFLLPPSSFNGSASLASGGDEDLLGVLSAVVEWFWSNEAVGRGKKDVHHSVFFRDCMAFDI